MTARVRQRIIGVSLGLSMLLLGAACLAILWSDPDSVFTLNRGLAALVVAPPMVMMGLALMILPPSAPPLPRRTARTRTQLPDRLRTWIAIAVVLDIVHLIVFFSV